MTARRITEDGDYRITEGGDYRILEGPDIGQVTLTGPNAVGRVSVLTHGSLATVSLSAPLASAVGYTSAVAHGSLPSVNVTVLTVALSIGQNLSVEVPSPITIRTVETTAAGGGFSLSPIAVSTIEAVAAAATGEAHAIDPLPEITVSSPAAGVEGQSLINPGLPDPVYVFAPAAEAAGAAEAGSDLPPVGVSGPLGDTEIQAPADPLTAIQISPVFGYAEVQAIGFIGVITVTVPRVSTGKKIKVADALFRGLENFDAIRQIKKS